MPDPNLALCPGECQRRHRALVRRQATWRCHLLGSAASTKCHHALVDIGGFEQLLTRPGRRLLEVAMTSYDDTEPLPLNESLRTLHGGYPADVVVAAMTQVTLRRAALAKFGDDAARMYFTPAGLEQATHPVVAGHRAARTRSALARSNLGDDSEGTVLDLGCGVGSDLVAFGRAGFDVTGVELDEVTAAVARANLAALGVPGSVWAGRAEDTDRRGSDVVFADPARRAGSTRLFDPRAFSPDWDFVLSLLSPREPATTRPTLAVVKLAPGLEHGLVPPHVEAEWVSLDGELKEAALWSTPPGGSAGGPVRRRATVLGSDRTVASCTDIDAPPEPALVAAVGRYLYEPDPAVIRAHLVSSLAHDLDGWLLDPHIAYVSADRQVGTPFARGFLVLETLPFKEKTLRAALRERGIGSLTIKKRGVAVTPEDLRRRLALRGPERATLLLSRTPGSAVALLVEPLGRAVEPSE